MAPRLPDEISRSQGRIATLDGWRGVSISLVVIGHTWNYRLAAQYAERVNLASELATVGVYAFFFISGFIITKICLHEYNTSTFSVRNFYLRRFFRIVPPFFSLLVVVAVASSLSLIDQSRSGIFSAGMFLCNINTNCGWFVGHTWSLAFEEQFYLLFPLALVMGGRRIGLIAGAIFLLIVSLPIGRFYLNLGEEARWLISFTVPFSFICAGCVAAAYERRLERLSQGKFAVHATFASALIIAGVLIGNTTQLFPLASRASQLLALLTHLGLPLCLGWVIGSSIYQRNVLTALLATPPVQFIGAISYSLYLWQQPFVAPRSLYLNDNIFLFWPGMFIAAWLSRQFIELPGIRLGKRIIRRFEFARLEPDEMKI
jgi:peptidoglycan/LPS O-acetylase OafA/YrhL